MELLQQTKALYRSFREVRPATDASVLQLREFLTTHFGHDGTVAIREVDEGTVMRKPAPTGRERKPWVHPLQRDAELKRAASMVQPQGTPVVLPEAGRPENFIANPPAPEAEPGKLDSSSGNLPLTSSSLPDAADNPEEKPIGKPVKSVDFETLGELKPKAAGALYPREVLIAALEEKGLPYNKSGGNTQLAAVLINWAKENV